MTRIIASTNATLDGAVMDPTGEEGTARGGWFARVDPADREAFGQAALREAVAADAFLMGRRTYEFLAARWPARTGALAERLTALPKFVVSATLDRPGWHNTTVLRDDPATAVAALRRRFAGEIVVPASYRLVRALLADQLVDEVRIIVYPVLLGTGGPAEALVAVIMFALLAAAITLPWRRIRRETSKMMSLIRAGSETTGQTTVRLTVLLLVALCVLAEVFDLDVVLGAFAAGFILRRALPSGDEQLEHKLNGLAFGLLIPVFFVTSGMAIDPAAVAAHPVTLILFVLMILLVRGLPVFIASKLERELTTGQHLFDTRDSARIGLFAATGLPIIVAVTSTAVSAGQMSSANASVLVAGGAITVLTMPLAATLLAGSTRRT